MELKKVEEKITEKLSEIGYDLESLKLKVVSGNQTLEIVVDRVLPIDMDAITEVTNVISALLDELDPFTFPYVLDISSLGAEKPLKMEKLEEYTNAYVHVHLINPIEGENIYEGLLEAVTEDAIKLSYKVKTRTKVVDIQKSNISKIRLAIKF